MISLTPFYYVPDEEEREKASFSYVMSLVALMAGMPIPIINLLATLFFFLGNRKSKPFVKWHCTQALLSQLSLLLMNSAAFWWTVSVFFYDEEITNRYMAYLITVFIFNLTEFIATIYTAVKVRKGIHVQWWFYGTLTNLLVRMS